MELSMVACDDQVREYPPRLYAEGASNLEGKTINHNSNLGDFPTIRESIGGDVWESMKATPLGIICKLADTNCVWSGKTVHYLLCRQLRIHKKEIWCLVGGQPIRLSLIEFGAITGLNTDHLPTEKFEPDYTAFWDELNVPRGVGPKLDELRPALNVCRGWSFEKRKWLGLLFLQAIGLYGLHHNSRIPFESAKRIFDDEAMQTYPWGRTAFEVLVDSVKMLNPQGRSYFLSGLKPVLLVWAYESITCFAERFGFKVKGVNDEAAPLFRWGGNRTRSSLDTIVSEELAAHGEVRVRKMIMKEAAEELFPEWIGEADDPLLDNLIADIHAGTFVEGFWDVKRIEKLKKRKVVVPPKSEHPAKKQRVREEDKSPKAASSNEAKTTEEDVEKKKKKEAKAGFDENLTQDVSVRTLLVMMEKMCGRFENFDGRFDNFEATIRGILADTEKVIGDRVEARIDERYGTRFTAIENDLYQIKERLRCMGVGETGQNEDGAANSNFHIQDLLKPPPPNVSVNSPLVHDGLVINNLRLN